jgi:hypothetical protein
MATRPACGSPTCRRHGTRHMPLTHAIGSLCTRD